MDKQKVHIGFMLNLNKEADREINNILKNLPPYEDVSKYIRKAILAYNGESVANVTVPAGASDDLADVIRSLSREISSIKDEMDRIKSRNVSAPTNTNDNTPEDTERQNAVSEKEEKGSKKQEKKPEKKPVVKEEIREETKEEVKKNDAGSTDSGESPAEVPPVKEEPKDENDISINTDTKPSKVSYNDFLGDFFS